MVHSHIDERSFHYRSYFGSSILCAIPHNSRSIRCWMDSALNTRGAGCEFPWGYVGASSDEHSEAEDGSNKRRRSDASASSVEHPAVVPASTCTAIVVWTPPAAAAAASVAPAAAAASDAVAIPARARRPRLIRQQPRPDGGVRRGRGRQCPTVPAVLRITREEGWVAGRRLFRQDSFHRVANFLANLNSEERSSWFDTLMLFPAVVVVDVVHELKRIYELLDLQDSRGPRVSISPNGVIARF